MYVGISHDAWAARSLESRRLSCRYLESSISAEDDLHVRKGKKGPQRRVKVEAERAVQKRPQPTAGVPDPSMTGPGIADDAGRLELACVAAGRRLRDSKTWGKRRGGCFRSNESRPHRGTGQ